MTDDRTIRVGETTEGRADGGLEADQIVTLPVEEILTGRAFATGKSGSGKSNSASVIAEQLLERGHPLLVIDIEGEYYSLKENYEVLHVGADDEVDLCVQPEHAEKLAELALEQHVPIVLDVSGYLDEDVRDELVYQTVRHLFAKEKTVRRPFLLIVEEIHEFIPERGGLADVGEMLIRVAKRGRKRGLGMLGASQRPANVKKDYITQADWLLWHRLTWSNDTKVVREVLSSDHSEAVEDLDDGEAFLQADFLDPEVRRVQFRRKETFDAGATPGLDDVERPELKSVSEDLVDELEEISDAADRRQDELAKKERRIEELEDEVESLEEQLARSEDVANLAERFTDAMAAAAGTDAGAGDGTGEIAVETIKADLMEVREDKRDLEEQLDDVQADRDRLDRRVDELESELADRDAADDLAALRDDVVELVQRNGDVLDVEAGGRVDDLERELRELREERDKLREHVQDEFDDVDELLAHPTVRERIGDTAENSHYADEHTVDAITALAGTEWVEKGQVAPYMGLGEASTGKVLGELANAGLVEKRKNGRALEYRLNRDALEAIVDNHRKRERVKAKREELTTESGSKT